MLNLHPEGKRVGDCVKRAIAKGFEKDYKEVSLELNRYKKITNTKEYNSVDNYRPYIVANGGVRMSFPAVAGKPRMNGDRMCEAYPRGRYILEMAGHTSVMVDGVIYDSWDCSKKCVYTAYKLPDAKPIQRRVSL
jgi:hypothetical protein